MKYVLAISVVCLVGCSKAQGPNSQKAKVAAPQSRFDERSIENTGAWVDAVVATEFSKVQTDNPLVRKDATDRIHALFTDHVGKQVTWEFNVAGFHSDKGWSTLQLRPFNLGQVADIPLRLPIFQAATHADTALTEYGTAIEISDDFYKRLREGDRITVTGTVEKFTLTGLTLSKCAIIQGQLAPPTER